MKRRLMGLAAAVIVAASIAYIAQPRGHIPPYDANLVRLAESQLQGYCAGETLFKGGDASMAAACRETHRASNRTNLREVEAAFCRGIIASGWEGTVPQCRMILVDNRLWPTYDGNVSDQWNRARPYPGSAINVGPNPEQDGSRTGGRNDVEGRSGSGL